MDELLALAELHGHLVDAGRAILSDDELTPLRLAVRDLDFRVRAEMARLEEAVLNR
jgi:hypothetical protein